MIARGTRPTGCGGPLLALWHDARGEWDQAHACVQTDSGPGSCWAHAYLHRKEGDVANAGHWYARAGRRPPATSLAAEWETIVRALLARGQPNRATDA